VRLAQHEPGGSPERPIAVESASMVEPRARGLPCAACGAGVRVEEHVAEVVDGVRLRIARVLCDQCHVRRAVWFRITEETLLN
jgi:hypothetical protein